VPVVVYRSRLRGSLVEDGAFKPGARTGLRIVGGLILLAGLVPLVRGGAPAILGTTAAGQVAEIRDHPRSGRVYDYEARIRFTDDQGRPVEVWRSFRHRTTPLAVGDPVTVAYFRGAPEGAQPDDRRAYWATGVTPAFLGALLLAVSFAGRRGQA
jgi:hypothetical protein